MTNLSKAREEFITGLENYMEEFYNLGYEKAKDECGQTIDLLQAEVCKLTTELNKYRVKQQPQPKKRKQIEITNPSLEDIFEALKELRERM